jgi:enoyl-CoA hydratase
VGLSAHGAYRVATENTLWAMPESAIGLFPDVGASHILSRLPGGLGLYIALLGARLSASDLIYAGIATHFVPSAALHALKEDIIASDGLDILQVLDSSAKPETGLDSSLCRHRMDIEECFAGKTSMLAIAEALEKNGSEWALQSLASLRKLCPMSLCVTVQQMKRGRDLSLMDCFIMEYRMSQRAVGRHDFVDGVRAMLIDKDGSPTWQPATWEGVEELDVQSFFEPLGQYDWRPQY